MPSVACMLTSVGVESLQTVGYAEKPRDGWHKAGAVRSTDTRCPDSAPETSLLASTREPRLDDNINYRAAC